LPQVLVRTIRREIADCSEKAYPSLPISNAKNLLFLNSEGAVVEFARERDWTLHDGRIYFPMDPESAAADEEQLITGQQPEKEIVLSSATIIENSIGYARQLEPLFERFRRGISPSFFLFDFLYFVYSSNISCFFLRFLYVYLEI
jgi:26S proteasome regulatory subunit N12